MKSLANTMVGIVASALTLGSFAVGQTQVITPTESLGDYARDARKDKKPATSKHYDNDNLPTTDKLSIVGNAPEPATTAAATDGTNAAPAAANADAANKLEVKPGQTPEERQKVYDGWKQKISQQKNSIDLLTRELDVTQREYQLRAAAFYADAGDRLRNSAAWDKEDANYKLELAAKQKALDDAKQQLDDLQEQARKAGAPSSARE